VRPIVPPLPSRAHFIDQPVRNKLLPTTGALIIPEACPFDKLVNAAK
jgi:hypothetical protein